MTIEDWRRELFRLFMDCKSHSSWPKNLHDAMEWQDDDVKEYLSELIEIDKRGAFSKKKEAV